MSDEPIAIWQRFELDDGDRDGIAFVEITRQQANVFERSGRHGRAGRVEIEIRELKSEAAAERSVQRRAETLTRKEYLSAGTVERPLPGASSREERARAKSELLGARAERMVRFEQEMQGFFEAWHARGYDPLGSFQQEGQKRREDWNTIAAACLELAASALGVHFNRRSVIDEEHGTLGPLRERELAAFYRSPAKVAHIALAKIRGELRDTDGSFPSWRSSSEQEARGDSDLDPRVIAFLARWRDGSVSRRT